MKESQLKAKHKKKLESNMKQERWLYIKTPTEHLRSNIFRILPFIVLPRANISVNAESSFGAAQCISVIEKCKSCTDYEAVVCIMEFHLIVGNRPCGYYGIKFIATGYLMRSANKMLGAAEAVVIAFYCQL